MRSVTCTRTLRRMSRRIPKSGAISASARSGAVENQAGLGYRSLQAIERQGRREKRIGGTGANRRSARSQTKQQTRCRTGMCEWSGGRRAPTGKVCRKLRTQAISVCAVLIATIAGFLDWRARRIPNWLTVPAFVAGIATNAFVSGTEGGLHSLEGAGAVMIVLLPVVLLRGLGGGDWKLMGALGAWLGPTRIIIVLLVTILVSGLLAVIQIIRKKRFVQTVRNMWELLRGFFIFGLQPHPEINLDNPAALSLPFGVAAALATFGCFCAGLPGW